MVRALNSAVTAMLSFVALAAIVTAIHMIVTATSGKNGNLLKFDRRIVVITDGAGYLDTADLDGIISKITDEDAKIEVTLLHVLRTQIRNRLLTDLYSGVDFDDPDYGFKEEEKNPAKVFNTQSMWSQLLSQTGGK
jgi:ATP-dependent DNA helicase 2 subunit 2